MLLSWQQVWTDFTSAVSNIVKLILAIVMMVMAIMILINICKNKGTRNLELIFWLLWLIVVGWSLKFSLDTIFNPSTYINIGVTVFIVARIIYLVFKTKTRKTSKKSK